MQSGYRLVRIAQVVPAALAPTTNSRGRSRHRLRSTKFKWLGLHKASDNVQNRFVSVLLLLFLPIYVLFLVKDAPSGVLEPKITAKTRRTRRTTRTGQRTRGTRRTREPGEPEKYENKRTRRTKSFTHFAIFYFHPNVLWRQSWGSYTEDDPCISATKTYWPKPSTRIFPATINKTKQKINFQSLRFRNVILTTIMSPKILFLL